VPSRGKTRLQRTAAIQLLATHHDCSRCTFDDAFQAIEDALRRLLARWKHACRLGRAVYDFCAEIISPSSETSCPLNITHRCPAHVRGLRPWLRIHGSRTWSVSSRLIRSETRAAEDTPAVCGGSPVTNLRSHCPDVAPRAYRGRFLPSIQDNAEISLARFLVQKKKPQWLSPEAKYVCMRLAHAPVRSSLASKPFADTASILLRSKAVHPRPSVGIPVSSTSKLAKSPPHQPSDESQCTVNCASRRYAPASPSRNVSNGPKSKRAVESSPSFPLLPDSVLSYLILSIACTRRRPSAALKSHPSSSQTPPSLPS